MIVSVIYDNGKDAGLDGSLNISSKTLFRKAERKSPEFVTQ